MQIGKYLWNWYETTTEMTSDDNCKIVYKDAYQSEVETDQNHTYVEISEFGLENTPDTSSTNE